MIAYDWLCSAVIGSCNKSSRISLNEQYNYVNGKTNLKKVYKQLTQLDITTLLHQNKT